MSQLLHIDAEYKQWIQELSLRYRQSQIYNLYSSLSENLRQPADDYEMQFCNYELIHPIGISKYELAQQQLPKDIQSVLPSVEEIENELNSKDK